MSILDNCDDIYQLRDAARRLLPRGIFEYVDRGSEDDKLLDENRAALDRLRVVPRFPEFVSRRDISLELFGKPITMPYIIAPTGTAGLVAYEGELALARAAAKAGIPYTLATGAQTSVEKIAREVPNGRNFMQLYLWKDRALSMQLVDRAQNNGFEALFLTMDTPVSPNRAYNKANGFSFPYKPTLKSMVDITLAPHWLFGTVGKYWMKNGGLPRFENYPEEFRTPITRSPLGDRVKHTEDLSWDDVSRLRDHWKGPFIVKGIMHPEDARIAVERGADGVVVSNHGGRNLDCSIASIDALPGIVAEVGHKTTVTIRQRHPARHRRRQGAVARRQGSAGRPQYPVGRGRRRRGRSQQGARHHPQRGDDRHGQYRRQHARRPRPASVRTARLQHLAHPRRARLRRGE